MKLKHIFAKTTIPTASKESREESNPSNNETFEDVLKRRFSRRAFLKGAAAAAPIMVIGPSFLLQGCDDGGNDGGISEQLLTFQPIEPSTEDGIVIPDGYTSQVLVRWGDPLFPGAPELDVDNQTRETQEQQFGYNCDFVGFFPLPLGSQNSNSGILSINNEFTSELIMFPGYVDGNPTQDQVEAGMAAHGVSIVEVERSPDGTWSYVVNSSFNRRITATTEIEVTGPAAGNELLRTSADPTGTLVLGTLNNCAGGKTPWGTFLTCEENFDQYFGNFDLLPDDDPRKAIFDRYGFDEGPSERRWELFDPRFDIPIEPNEPNRFGWVVEIDPYDPNFVPKKRTALGRNKHEGATMALAQGGQVVFYSGDDTRFDYVYKFVTAGAFDPNNREANFSLLDEGTLYVARFNDDGTGVWLPLVFGQDPLTPANGFNSQAEVLINTRGAADLLGPTGMDRPEDIETNPANGRVYCLFTNNTNRGVDDNPGTDAANPRPNNEHGHVIELTEGGGDPAATTFTWEIFILCGDPASPPEGGVFFAGFDPDQVSPISSPDNCTFDGQGNLWLATDGQPGALGNNDAIHAVPVEGEERGFLRQFLSGPVDCELCGPEFTPDFTTLFCAIQHPGDGDDVTFENPTSTWPDETIPPRPSVISIVRDDGNVIGT